MKIAFVGDVCSKGIWDKKLSGGQDLIDRQVSDLLQSHQVVVGNLEGPISKANEARCLNSPEMIRYLKRQGLNTYTLANNHIFDLGYEEFEKSTKLLGTEDIKHFGAGKDLAQAAKVLYLKEDGITLGLIGVAHREGDIASKNGAGVFCIEDTAALTAAIKQAHSSADRVILVYHGGEEFTLFPMPARRRSLHELTSLPIDLIICHHPHVVQGCEVVNNTPIYYSLGNFMVDSPRHDTRDYTNRSAVLSVDIGPSGLSHRLYPVLMDRENGLVTMDSSDDNAKRFAASSDFGSYQRKWQAEAHRVYSQGRPPLLTGMFDEHARPILLGALKYFFRKIFGL